MAKRPSKHLRTPRPLLAGGAQRRVTKAAGSFIVRDVPAQRAEKEYRCPGCSQKVAAGTAHVVVWPDTPPVGVETGLELRRHWHSHCWAVSR